MFYWCWDVFVKESWVYDLNIYSLEAVEYLGCGELGHLWADSMSKEIFTGKLIQNFKDCQRACFCPQTNMQFQVSQHHSTQCNLPVRDSLQYPVIIKINAHLILSQTSHQTSHSWTDVQAQDCCWFFMQGNVSITFRRFYFLVCKCRKKKF